MDTTNWLQSAKDPSPDPGTHHRSRGLGWSAPWSTADDVTLAELHAQFGERWAAIAQRMPGRTAVQIKSRWHGKQRGKTARHPTFLDAYLRHLQHASCPNHYHNDDTPSAAAERRVAALSKARAMLAAGELADVRPRASRPLLNRGRAARSSGTGGGGSGSSRKRSLSPRGGGDEDTDNEEEDNLIGPYSSSRLAPPNRAGGAYATAAAAAAVAAAGGKRAACALPPMGPQQQPTRRWHVAAAGAGNAIGGVDDAEEFDDMLLEADRLRPQHTLCWRSCRAAGVSWQSNTSGGHSDSDGAASDALAGDGGGNSAFGGGDGGSPSPTAAAAGGSSRGAATCYANVDDDVGGGGRLGRLGGGGCGEPIEVDDDALDRVLSVEEAELSALSFIDGLIGLRGALPPAALQRPVALPPPPPPPAPPPPLPLPHARALAPLVLQAPFALRPTPPPPPPGEQLWLAMEARCRHCDGNGRKRSRYRP